AQGYPVRISRLEQDMERRQGGLMIITLSANQRLPDLDAVSFQYPTLVVLPKWEGRIDPLDQTRQQDTRFLTASVLNDRITPYYSDAEILRIPVPDRIKTPFGEAHVAPDIRLQLIRSEALEPLAGDKAGMLLGYDSGRQIYILSDPDLINTFGLARRDNAIFATKLVSYLRGDSIEPILFDATLHGFQRSENLLKMLFSVPFIGATLVALASALLLGWGAAIRFGPPAREGRAIALGKQALADNSAGLVTMARRETRMASGYAALIRRRLAAALGLPRGLTEHQLAEMFDRMGPASGSEQVFTDMETGLRDHTTSREDLVERARGLHHWHKDIIRRTLHERG
ncbi:MAG: hypothetical protein ACK46Q_15885, partial [Hyphomonas sp.]